MNVISPQSYWHELSGLTSRFAPLPSDIHVDVAVVGAGITGLTAALRLKGEGKRVAVLEAGYIGGGTSGGTTAHLDIHPEQGFDKLLSTYGESASRELTGARRSAIDQIEDWCGQLAIDCDFVRLPGYLYTETEEGREGITQQHKAARQLGVVASLEHLPLPIQSPIALRLEGQARFHILQYLHGLAAHVHGDNGAIYEQTRVLHAPQDASPCVLETQHGKVYADDVILATHSPFLGISVFDTVVAPYQSYVLGVELEEPLTDALYWDDDSPYHYIRRADLNNPHMYLIGGADHKTGQADEQDHFQELEQYVHARFRVRRIHQRWSAELFEPVDSLPLIGRVPMTHHLYLATGFSGIGMTWGTAAGRLLADLILEKSSTLADIVSPSRFHPQVGAARFVKENFNAAAHFVMDRWRAEDVDALDELPAGEGQIVKHDGQILAVYKDDAGALHACAAKCTHAGCIVQWNNAESTWDCPCHGGRYTPTGQRLYGPPPADLAPAELPEHSV